MNDPEVQQIMSDPAMRMILEQMQSDPQAVQVSCHHTGRLWRVVNQLCQHCHCNTATLHTLATYKLNSAALCLVCSALCCTAAAENAGYQQV